MSSAGFTFVTAGKRDSYQIPIALHEAGMLDCMVADYYADTSPGPFVPKSLRSWHDPKLPRSKCRVVWQSISLAIADRVLKLRSKHILSLQSAFLKKATSRVARKLGSNIYSYHAYFPTDIPDDACVIVFVYHPLSAFEREIRTRHALIDPETGEPGAIEFEEYLSIDMNLDWSRIDAVVCASRFTARSVIADGCDPEKITVIPYGSPISQTQANAHPPVRREEGAPVKFLFVGQGVQRKGLHILLRAWEEWRKQSSLPAELTIVSYFVEPELRNLIDHPEINLLGHQSRENLDRIFAESDIFVLPSLVEGFGLAYLEALAMGCHLIGTENTGLPELPIGDGERTLVEAGSVESLVDGLQSCATRALAGQFDREQIMATASNWTQDDFRKRIAEHARSELHKFEMRKSR